MVLSNGVYRIFSRITNNKGNQIRLVLYEDHLLDANDSSKVRALPSYSPVVV